MGVNIDQLSSQSKAKRGLSPTIGIQWYLELQFDQKFQLIGTNFNSVLADGTYNLSVFLDTYLYLLLPAPVVIHNGVFSIPVTLDIAMASGTHLLTASFEGLNLAYSTEFYIYQPTCRTLLGTLEPSTSVALSAVQPPSFQIGSQVIILGNCFSVGRVELYVDRSCPRERPCTGEYLGTAVVSPYSTIGIFTFYWTVPQLARNRLHFLTAYGVNSSYPNFANMSFTVVG